MKNEDYPIEETFGPLPMTIEELIQISHNNSLTVGWWHDTDPWNPYIVPTKLMLIVSEIAEAMEGDRRNRMDDKLPNRKMIEVELADAMIRIADLAGWLALDLEGAIREKWEYNKKRADHKQHARKANNGKTY